MGLLTTFFKSAWKYRVHIVLLAKVASEAWKTAQELTRDYIRFLVKQKLKRQILIILIEIGALISAHYLVLHYGTLYSRLFASTVLWVVTLYNIFDFTLVTLPELNQVYRTLRGRVGYTLKHFLQISITNELLEWNILLLGFCCFLAFTSRTVIATSFSYLAPWKELFF